MHSRYDLCTFSMALGLDTTYVHSLWLSVSLCKMRAHDRASVLILVVLVCDILCGASGIRYVLTKMVKVLGVLEFDFLEW